MPEAKKPTLLIVDDDPDMRALFAVDFRRQGYRILEAEGGWRAIDLLRSQKVDLVVTDILMPGGDGIELMDRIQKLCPECPPVVVVTGCTHLSQEELGARGAGAIFFKPYDRKVLSSTVQRLAARQA